MNVQCNILFFLINSLHSFNFPRHVQAHAFIVCVFGCVSCVVADFCVFCLRPIGVSLNFISVSFKAGVALAQLPSASSDFCCTNWWGRQALSLAQSWTAWHLRQNNRLNGLLSIHSTAPSVGKEAASVTGGRHSPDPLTDWDRSSLTQRLLSNTSRGAINNAQSVCAQLYATHCYIALWVDLWSLWDCSFAF